MSFIDKIDELGFTWHLRLNESSGTVAADRIGGDDATYAAGATLDQVGGGADGDAAVSFDGASGGNYVEVESTNGVSAEFDIKNDRSLFLTVNLDTLAKDQVLWQMGGQQGGVVLYTFGSDSELYLAYVRGFGDVHSVSTPLITALEWLSIGYIHNTIADEAILYINGSPIVTFDTSGFSGKGFANSAEFVCLGDAQGSSSDSARRARFHSGAPRSSGQAEVDGLFGEVAYASGVVLTAQQVTDLHNEWVGAVSENKTTNVAAQAGVSANVQGSKGATTNVSHQAAEATSVQALKAVFTSVSYQAGISAVVTHGAVPDLSSWEPPSGHSAYAWQEGAAWIDVTAASLGITPETADIVPILATHISDNRDDRIRYVFPAGVFTLASQLNINRDEKRIVGAGSDQTFFRAVADGRIRFGGGDGSTSNLTAAPSRGATQISVLDASIATVGETIAIKQTADDTVTGTDDNTSPYSVGTISVESFAEDPWAQIVEVTAVDTGANTIDFTPELALDYDIGKTPYAKDFNNIIDAGLEGFTLDIIEDEGTIAIEFDRVKNGYIKDVRVQNFSKYGISVRESFEVEISECRIIHGQRLGTGGNGYGIHLQLATTRAYVHDNAIASDYRHALIIETGASHNIFAYNYIAVASAVDLTDLSIHGHYVHHNLFEGNVLHGCVEINDFYPQTLQNVLFRNRILGNSNFWDSSSSDYAFWLRRNSVAALVANRCETSQVARVFDGSESSLIEANGNSDSAPAWAGDSRYLSSAPASALWSGYTWPPFAGDTVNTIPAQDFDLSIAKLTHVAYQSEVSAWATVLLLDSRISSVVFQSGMSATAGQAKGAAINLLGQEEISAFLQSKKDALARAECQEGGSVSATSLKGSTTSIEGQAGVQGALSTLKSVSVEIAYNAGSSSSVRQSTGFTALVSVEAQAGVSAWIQSEKGAQSNISVQLGASEIIQGFKGAASNAYMQAGAAGIVQTEKAAIVSIEHLEGARYAVTTSVGKTINLEYQGGGVGYAAQELILVPSIITLSIEHLHQIGLSLEGIHNINLTIEHE